MDIPIGHYTGLAPVAVEHELSAVAALLHVHFVGVMGTDGPVIADEPDLVEVVRTKSNT
jgi:hypothetical protein